MGKISKDVAKSIAKKMVEKTFNLKERLKKEYSDLVRSEYEKQTPDIVLSTKEKHPDWFKTTGTIVLNGCGFRHEHVYVKPYVIGNNNGNAHMVMSPKIGEKLKKSYNKYSEASAKYESLLRETTQALLALGTHKRIKETFPEASELLPPPVSTSLVVNFDSLSKRLKSQPKIEPVVIS